MVDVTSEIALSIIVPALDEEVRLPATLRRILDWADGQRRRVEIVVVDDGSADRTAEVAVERGDSRVRLLRLPANRGKGAALRAGVAASRGAFVLVTDADLSTPIEEAAALLAALEAGADVAIGSRKMPGATIVVHQPWLRERLGKVFTWLARQLIADVSDVTCGFKAFRGAAARDIFSRVRVYDWSFDAEVLLLATRLGYRLREVPVRWADCAGTKVRLGRDVLRSLEGLARIRLNAARGRYAHPVGLVDSVASWESVAAPAIGTPNA